MTKVEYIEKFGRAPEEVAHILHDFIVAPLDWAIEREGSLDMESPYVWREAIPGTNECRTVGCMGAWIALFFNSSGESTLDVEIEGSGIRPRRIVMRDFYLLTYFEAGRNGPITVSRMSGS